MFILTLGAAYEGETVLGVYSSQGQAETASEEFITSRGSELRGSERFIIREIEVDAPAVYHW
jgi:hypothetical protein